MAEQAGRKGVQVRVDCARCATPMEFAVPGPEAGATCATCGYHFEPQPRAPDGQGLERCAACGEAHLYRQKDLNRTAGLLVVLGSAAISLALLPFSPLAVYSVLFLLAVVDLGLYRLLPEVIICYRCKAQHRGLYRRPRSSRSIC